MLRTNKKYHPIYNESISYWTKELQITTIFHIKTTGHYWRNSQITEIGVLKKEESHWLELSWTSQQESDEYDMLEAFSKELNACDTICGYNSTSFHLPFLEQKYRAYGLANPFIGIKHTDLLLTLKPLSSKLRQSLKLKNLKLLPDLNSDMDDIEVILESTALLTFADIFSGNFSVADVSKNNDSLQILCMTSLPAPYPVHIRQESFYMVCEKNKLRILVKCYENRIRIYYPDYENYVYLPEEDTAVHKSMASCISKERRIKADASNCYTYAPVTDTMLQKPSILTNYLTALFQSC